MAKISLFLLAVFLSGLALVRSGPLSVLTRAQATAPVFVGAGDITHCSRTQDELTAQLLDGIAGTVFTLGDNAYPDGTLADFNDCYAPTWGRHKERTRPSLGNHDYHLAGAPGYYTYFGAAASPLDSNCTSHCKGYYSYNLSDWHIIVLNSESYLKGDLAQEQWLRADLAANQSPCTLAYWHHPRFSSRHGIRADILPFWQALYEYGADVVLNGHDHLYERYALQNPSGQADPTRGIRQFIVGTGGAGLYPFVTILPNSEARNNTDWGVLKLTLHATSYDWEFVPVAGQSFTDVGSADCVGDSPIPTATNTPEVTVSPTPANTPTPTNTPGSGDRNFVSSTSGGTAGGVSFADEDVLTHNTNAGVWTTFFDGSDVGVQSLDVDAFAWLSDGSFLLGFDVEGTVGTLGLVDDSDIVRFVPTSLGTVTAGTFAWYFDGSDAELTTNGEDIDALALLGDGRLVVSTIDAVRVTGVTGADEDLVVFSPTQLGQTTSGTWALYFDGSDVELSQSGTEDVNGVWIDPATGNLYLTTNGAFAVTNVSGDGSDIFACAPGSLGVTTQCVYRSYWDGSANGFAGEVTDVVEVEQGAQSLSSVPLLLGPADEHTGERDDPLANPNEGPDDVTKPDQAQQLFLPLMLE